MKRSKFSEAQAARATEAYTRLKLELEKERVHRLQLEHKVKPRQLTTEQRAKFVAGLRNTSWQKAEIIWHGTGEPEAYARDIGRVFGEAGMSTTVHTLGAFLPSGWGLKIVKSGNPNFAKLKQLCDDAGIC